MLGCVVAGVRSQGSARELGLHLLLEEEDTRSPAEQQVTGGGEGGGLLVAGGAVQESPGGLEDPRLQDGHRH